MLRYVRSDSVVSRVIAGETLIVPVRKGVGDLASIYSLNEVASTIWHALASARSQTEIVEQIASEFDIAAAPVASDISQFLIEMQSAGLIEQIGDAA